MATALRIGIAIVRVDALAFVVTDGMHRALPLGLDLRDLVCSLSLAESLIPQRVFASHLAADRKC